MYEVKNILKYVWCHLWMILKVILATNVLIGGLWPSSAISSMLLNTDFTSRKKICQMTQNHLLNQMISVGPKERDRGAYEYLHACVCAPVCVPLCVLVYQCQGLCACVRNCVCSRLRVCIYLIAAGIYRVCNRFRLTKREDYFWVNFDHFWIVQCFWRQGGGSIENLLEPKTEPHREI
jgi:hypothetical protein